MRRTKESLTSVKSQVFMPTKERKEEYRSRITGRAVRGRLEVMVAVDVLNLSLFLFGFIFSVN